MKIRSFAVIVENGYSENMYGPLPVMPRDLKALAAWLNAFADAPEKANTRIGPFRVQVEVDDEV